MSALPHKYVPSTYDPAKSPPRPRKRRDSQSPERREYETQGGGYGSRRRSPGAGGSRRYERDRDRDRDRDGDWGGGRGDRNGRGGDRDAGRPRDNGYAGRRVKQEEYSADDRERERQMDRTRYEEGAVDKPAEPVKPNFGASGLLAKETNTVKGVQVKYNEPPEARKPLKNWRLYVFKGKDQVDLVHIYRQSCYLIGRDENISLSGILRARNSMQRSSTGKYRKKMSMVTSPHPLNLESTNGTHVNDQEIPKSRYYELRNTDVIKFGTSAREYVLLHEDASAT